MAKSILETILDSLIEQEMKKKSDCKIQIKVKNGVMSAHVEGYGFGIITAYVEGLAKHLLEDVDEKKRFENLSTATVSLLKAKLEQGAKEKWQ